MMGAGADGIILIAKALDFAADHHKDQRRKGPAREPYINHLSEVARLVAEATAGKDPGLVAAALLHDVIEDQGVSQVTLVKEFGADVADLVAEVTDDKSLPKEERKRLQIENASKKSARAKVLALADKTANLRSLLAGAPSDWPQWRIRDYLDWSRKVVATMRGVCPTLESEFDRIAHDLETALRR